MADPGDSDNLDHDGSQAKSSGSRDNSPTPDHQANGSQTNTHNNDSQINVGASGSRNSDRDWLNSPSHSDSEDSTTSKKHRSWDFVKKIAKGNISKKRKRSHSKHKAKKSKRRKYDSSSSSSSSSTTSDSDSLDDMYDPTASDKSDWNLTDKQAKYVKMFWLKKTLPYENIREKILKHTPVPKNKELKSKERDEFMTHLSQNHFVLDQENRFKTLQDKLSHVMGPLGLLWSLIEQGKSGAKVNLDNLKVLLEKSVLLLGQAHQLGTYYRRITCLSPVVNYSKIKAKQLMKTHMDVLKKSGDKLFGDKMKKVLLQESKSKKEMSQIRSTLRGDRDKPFQKTPTSGGRGRGRSEPAPNTTRTSTVPSGASRGKGRGYVNKSNRGMAQPGKDKKP
ncbi:unnamed protein product [Owenia fusiformis]|uniref:Uncharacterized protein n=1 Tax=Owenia fusiformis TaxID=6347 RepID=A0A8J1T4H7_OWEFU|nr:unnamed protein product [Owenia fusiformis]